MATDRLARSLGIVGFFACLAFVPGTLAFATVPKWCVLCVGAAALLFTTRFRPGKAHWWGFGLIAYALASLFWVTVLPDAGMGLGLLSLAAILFCLGAECEDLTPVYRWLAIGLVPSTLTMAFTPDWETAFWWNPNPIGGLFGNRNYVGELAAPVLIGLFDVSVPIWFIASPVAALGLSGCRGAMMGLAGVLVILAGHWSRFVALGLAFLSVFAFGFSLKHSWAVSAIRERGIIWLDTWDGLTLWGRGIGQYRATVPEFGPRMAALFHDSWHAHSDPLELIYELGPGALLAVAVVVIAFRRRGRAREKLVLACFLIEGLVGLPLHEPMGLFLGSVVAGHLCGADRVVRGGMAGGIYSRGHRQPRCEERQVASRGVAARV